MTISLDDPLFRHYLEERPTLTYAQPIPYDWVPESTPRPEKSLAPIDIKNYRVQ